MNKQTFQIPEGCKAITMEIIDNMIVTTFEPVEPKFKRGDVLICYDETVNKDIGRFIFIFKDLVPDDMNNGMCAYVCLSLKTSILDYEDKFASDWDVFRHATPEEAQRLWDALAKEGKRWNPETLEVDEIKKELWRAEQKGVYWTLDISDFRVFPAKECNDYIDNKRYKSGHYFKTEKQAQLAANKIKATLDEFWKEELK